MPFSFYVELEKTITQEVANYQFSPYQDLIPMQMELYQQIEKGVTEDWLNNYIGKLQPNS